MKKHPWLQKYRITPSTKYLIIGTHPPMPYCGKLNFYYGNMSEFWRFMDRVYPGNNFYNDGCPKENDIITFLEYHNFFITDMVEETDGSSFSTDNDMHWIKLNSSLKNNISISSVERIYFTSFGGKNSALSLFKKWLKLNGYNNIKIPDSKLWRKEGMKMTFEDKIISLDVLFSPSPTARRNSSKIKEYKEWKIIKPMSSFDEFRIDWYKNKLPNIY